MVNFLEQEKSEEFFYDPRLVMKKMLGRKFTNFPPWMEIGVSNPQLEQGTPSSIVMLRGGDHHPPFFIIILKFY